MVHLFLHVPTQLSPQHIHVDLCVWTANTDVAAAVSADSISSSSILAPVIAWLSLFVVIEKREPEEKTE